MILLKGKIFIGYERYEKKKDKLLFLMKFIMSLVLKKSKKQLSSSFDDCLIKFC